MRREGLTALLVDDSRLDYLHTRGLLLGSRADVVRLAWLDRWPGVDAALADGPFDLFLVDLHLGSHSGLDVIRELRGAGVLVPIIALTGLADETIDHACTEAGASDFLVKGRFDRLELERTIRYAQRQAGVHDELDRLNTALARRATAEGEQASLMRFAIEQSTDAIFLSKAAPTAASQPIVYVNAAASRLLMRRAGDLLGSDVGDLLVAPIVGLDEALGRQSAYLGDAVLNAAGRPVDASLQATPLRADETVTHYVWTARDPLPSSTASQARRQQVRLAAVGRITGGVAHEMNDRLTAIIGNLERAAMKAGPDDASRAPLVAALKAAEELATQSRLVAGLVRRAEPGVSAPFDPVAMLTDIRPLLQHAAGPLTRIAWTAPPVRDRLIDGDAAPLLEALILVIAWLAGEGHGGDLEIGIDDRVDAAAQALTKERTASGAPHRDLVRLTVTGRKPVDADPGTVELREADALVRETGGALVVERPDAHRIVVRIDLPRG